MWDSDRRLIFLIPTVTLPSCKLRHNTFYKIMKKKWNNKNMTNKNMFTNIFKVRLQPKALHLLNIQKLSFFKRYFFCWQDQQMMTTAPVWMLQGLLIKHLMKNYLLVSSARYRNRFIKTYSSMFTTNNVSNDGRTYYHHLGWREQ